MVGQRLDSNLGLLGNPLPIAAAQSLRDVTNIEVHSSSRYSSQVLVAYTAKRGQGIEYFGTVFSVPIEGLKRPRFGQRRARNAVRGASAPRLTLLCSNQIG